MKNTHPKHFLSLPCISNFHRRADLLNCPRRTVALGQCPRRLSISTPPKFSDPVRPELVTCPKCLMTWRSYVRRTEPKSSYTTHARTQTNANTKPSVRLLLLRSPCTTPKAPLEALISSVLICDGSRSSLEFTANVYFRTGPSTWVAFSLFHRSACLTMSRAFEC